jgi:predicted RNA binding protein with dsRBD fold (UPF0201 family)
MSEVYSVDVEVTAPVNDTEVVDRVADAVTNLFPNAAVERSEGELLATTHTVEHFAERLREQEILDTARREFLERRRGDTFTFALSKQPAFVGVVNFSVGEPGELGDLHVSVRVNDPTVEQFVDRLAPPTKDGSPVEDDWG